MGVIRDLGHYLGVPRRRARVGAHQSYGVTPLGKQKAEEFALSGPRLKVLQHISENAPCSVTEVEKECGMNNEKVMVILRTLMNDGYVQPVAQGD